MLIIPEMHAVVITPPRTGSTAIRDAVFKTYRSAFSPYRHMERDGIPYGYGDYKVYCTFRDPLSRMQSLWRYFSDVSNERNPHAPPLWIKRLNHMGKLEFSDWLTLCQEQFNEPFDDQGFMKGPYVTKRVGPITRKPVYDYARPDLGPVTIAGVQTIASRLGMGDVLTRQNTTDPIARVELTNEARAFMNTWHGKDYALALRLNGAQNNAIYVDHSKGTS